MDVINDNILQCSYYTRPDEGRASIAKEWKTYTMSMNRFLKAADTGDLILIKFNDDEDKLDIDPAYYNYKFNHVAMIVIAQREGVSENIMILESSHGKGVRLIPIDAYITSLLPGIESMCYKRLTGIRRLDN